LHYYDETLKQLTLQREKLDLAYSFGGSRAWHWQRLDSQLYLIMVEHLQEQASDYTSNQDQKQRLGSHSSS
jgi:hypothetical protein